MTNSERFSEARKWVESLDQRWRLQILSRKFRIDKSTGEKVELPTRIRRFVEGVPWSLVQDSIDYLLSIAPYSDVVYNGVPIEGTYRPTVTSWTRDDKDSTVSTTSSKTNDGTYTLIQDLVEDGATDSLNAETGGSCSEETVTEWHWDENGVVDLRSLGDYGSQGVTYAVQAVNRNEDGTFDYALVRRTARTQHSPETTVTDDAFVRVTEETWDNVYGTVGSFSGRGIDVSIPTAGLYGNTKTEVRTSENQDCTFKVSVTRTVTKSVSQTRITESDIFSSKETDIHKGYSQPLPDASPAQEGVTCRNENQRQPDGTFTTSKSTETETPVTNAVEEVSVGRKGKRSTVTNRNVLAPVPTSSIDLGGAVKNEKTPGGLFNTTVSSWIRNSLARIGDICRIDLFSHRHTVERSGVDSIPETDVSGSGSGGKVITRTTRMDDDGAITESVETETERPVTDSRVSYTVGLFGKRIRRENRNQVSPISEPVATAKNVGTTVVNERTPGGLYNTVVEELDRDGSEVKTGMDCSKTVFEHSDTETVRTSDGIGEGHVVDAGNGNRYSRVSSLNEDGSVTTRISSVSERTVDGAEVSYQRTRRALVTSVTTKNGTKVAAVPENIGSVSKHSVTPGGRYDLTEVNASVDGTQVDSGYYRGSALSKANDKVRMSVGKTVDVVDEGYTKGKIKTVTADVDEYGIIKTVTRIEDERTGIILSQSKERLPSALVTTTVSRKASSSPVPSSGESSKTVRMTEAGNFDETVQTAEPATSPDGAYSRVSGVTETNDDVTFSKAISSGRPSYSAGTIVTVTQSKDQYGIVKKVVRTETEKQIDSVSSSAEKTTRAVVVTTTNRRSAPESLTIQNIGDSVTNRMTEYGNFDVTIRSVEASTTPDSSYHRVSAMSSVDDKITMSKELTSEIPQREDGTIVTSSEDTDQYGVVKKVVRTETETVGLILSSSSEKLSRGTIDTTTTRVSTMPATTTPENIGETISYKMTEAGNYDVTKKEIGDETHPDSAYGKATALSTTVDIVSVTKTDEVEQYDDIQRENGTIVTKTKELDNYGLQKETTRTETEEVDIILARSRERVKRGTVNSITKRLRTDISQDSDLKIGEAASAKITEAGNYDNVSKTLDVEEGKADYSKSFQSPLEKYTDTSQYAVSDTVPEPEAYFTDDGHIKTVTSDVDEYGFVRTVTREEYASPSKTDTIKANTGMSQSEVVVFANSTVGEIEAIVSSNPAPSPKIAGGDLIYPTSISLHVSAHYNKFGLLDGTITKNTVYPSSVLRTNASVSTIRFTVRSISVSPIFANEYDEDTGELTVTHVKKQIISWQRYCEISYGLGCGSLQNFMTSGTGQYAALQGSYARYDQTTGEWSACRIYGADSDDSSWNIRYANADDLFWSGGQTA